MGEGKRSTGRTPSNHTRREAGLRFGAQNFLTVRRPQPRHYGEWVPIEPFAARLGDHKIVTTLCPGGKERMRRLMERVRHGRLNLPPLFTHTFSLENILEAYRVVSERREGGTKVAIKR